MSIDIGVALVTGDVLGWVLFPVEEDRFHREQVIEDARNVRDSRRDNIRFVREVATQSDTPSRPFSSLDVREAELTRLKLGGADFTRADLTRADLIDARLDGARLVYCDVTAAAADVDVDEITFWPAAFPRP